MKQFLPFVFAFSISTGISAEAFSATIIPANDPNIQYYGRWDFATPSAPTHSWPGVYIFATFEGTSVGVSTNDNFSYYNVFIDDTIFIDFHGTASGVSAYTLKSGLRDTVHTVLITLRNETNWTKFSFNGFILDDGRTLLPSADEPAKGIEFIGDSYTCASGDLWTDNTAAPSGDWTDLYEGFPSIIARHYGAQYNVTAHSGYGLVLDYQGNYSNNLPSIFGSTVAYAPTPAWNFSAWKPNLVVICLGLNDYTGWGGYSTGTISAANTAAFKQEYHNFISRIMDVYPHAKILAVAANGITWLMGTISQVVAEEDSIGHTNVSYAYFPYYTGGYVNGGHPNVATHQEIADTLIATINKIDPWTPFIMTTPPSIVDYPDSSFIVTTPIFTLNIRTAEYDSVRYSTSDKPYDQMENQFAVTGTRVHSTVLDCHEGQKYTYYLRAKDAYGIAMDTSVVIRFSVDTTKTLLSWNRDTSYDFSDWKAGKAPLGNDNAVGDSTEVSPATTVYFKQTVSLSDVNSLLDFRIFVEGHDGAVAYVNGKEIGRVNIDANAVVSYNTFALVPAKLANSIVMSSQDRANYLRNGENVVAVEIHSRETAVPDIAFDAMVVNNFGLTYINFGQEWYYYDRGNAPPDQLVDKSTLFVDRGDNFLPTKTSLFQNYPNPFNPATKIKYQTSTMGRVRLSVFDVLGREVGILVDESEKPGVYETRFDASHLASGVYFYRLESGSYVYTRKMLLVK